MRDAITIQQHANYTAKITQLDEKNGVRFYHLLINQLTQGTPETLRVQLRLPSCGAFSIWNPSCGFNRALWPEWKKNHYDSRISVGAPVQTVIGMDGKNILTVAVADVKTPIQIGTGISEQDAALCCDITFFTLPMAPFDRYETTLRIDTRSIAYEQSVKAVGTWWEEFYNKADVPEIARMPVYSTWYSFHQAFTPDEIEEQCRMAKDMGMESIIVDDGWQTEDSSLGYAYCGDWEPADSKVGDIRAALGDATIRSSPERDFCGAYRR